MYSAQARGISHAIKVGDTIYVAGQVALDEERNVIGQGDCTAQATKVFGNIKMVLEDERYRKKETNYSKIRHYQPDHIKEIKRYASGIFKKERPIF